MPGDRPRLERDLYRLLGAALAVRLLCALVCPVLTYVDSAGYFELAGRIAGWDWTGWRGERTPLYPLLLLTAGRDPQVVVLLQAGLGVATAVLLWRVFRELSGSARPALAAALAFALNPSQLLFERSLLSESLCTFLVALTFLLFLQGLRRERGWWPAAGAAAGLAALARPPLALLPLLAALWAGGALWRAGQGTRIAAGGVLLVLLPALALLGGWSAFNQRHTGYFGLTTLPGFNLTNHTGAFLEQAQGEDRELAEIYLAHRAQVERRSGTWAMTIWQAIPELERQTGLSYPELSRRFLRLSLRLIREHPGQYLRTVGRAAVYFWLPTWYDGRGGWVDLVKRGQWRERLLLGVYGALHAAAMLLFLALPIAALLRRPLRKLFTPGVSLIYAVVLSAWAVQALMEFGENARYKQSLEPLVIGVALLGAARLWRRRAESPALTAGEDSGR